MGKKYEKVQNKDMMDLIAGFLISPLSYKYEPMWTKTSPGVEWRVVANFKKNNPDIYKFLWYLYARVFLPIIQSLLIKPNWYDALFMTHQEVTPSLRLHF